MTQSAAVPLNVTEKRILGCLYGQATGDAMGMPSELWPKSRVRQHFGWIDTFLPGPEENIAANEFVAGEFTDVNPAVGRGRACCLLAWRSVGVDDVDLRFNRPAESGGT